MRGKTKRGRIIYADWSSQSPNMPFPHLVDDRMRSLAFLIQSLSAPKWIDRKTYLFIDRQDTYLFRSGPCKRPHIVAPFSHVS